MGDLAAERAKLEETRREVRMLTVAGLRDNLTPQQRANYRSIERSAWAEVRLRQKALEHLESQQPKSVGS
jgi:hypothetical protein